MEWKNDNYILVIESFDVEEWNYLVDCLASEPSVEIWDSRKISDFRYHVHMKTSSETGIHLKYWHNSQLSSNMGLHKLQIKFNFNKVKCTKLFDWLCSVLLFKHLKYIRISTVDMCTDVDAPITSFIVDKGRKKNARSFNSTLYFGDRGRNGAVKIYDKGKELGTDDIVTRYEVTIKPMCMSGSMGLLDKEFVAQYSLVDAMIIDTWQMGFDLDPMLKAAVLCVMNGDMSVNEFGRYQKKKIKDFMGQMKSFSINDTSIPIINKAILDEKEKLINYITMIHDRCQFGNIEEIPFD